ncbi:MAG: hypothetical protein U1F36_19535 [Planctomycetota bacterium]
MTRAALLVLALSAPLCHAQENYKHTGSGRTYAHWIELHDQQDRVIDPAAEDAPPFSMRATCKKCHDLGAMEKGWHFAAATSHADAGRAGEPWILVDPRTGTQLPLSYRGWKGSWKPEQVGVSAERFVAEFGRHLPGGASSYAGVDPTKGRFRVGGPLDVDCMVCHGRGSAWSHERWAKAIEAQDYAWASARALGLIDVEGDVKSLPDDLDPNTPEGRAKLPKTRYDRARFAADGRVFFDVARLPSDEACATCHSVQEVGKDASPRWMHDRDVHLRAGLHCADCHRNGLEHHTVRGFEGEHNASGVTVDSLTCRGCHTDTTDGHGNATAHGGRLGAPLAEHRGLPAVHLQKLSCTACHAGPRPLAAPQPVQTSLAHALGVPSQTRAAEDLPAIVEPVFSRDTDGVIRPHRVVWPSFWGFVHDDAIEPLSPDAAFATVRRALRVRKDMVAELGEGDEARKKIAAGLAAFAKTRSDATPVYVSGGRAWRLAADGESLESVATTAADPVSWPVAHDVRPARDALGARGCTECHAGDSPFVHGRLTAHTIVPDTQPPTQTMADAMGLDPVLVQTWETSFRGRDAFKWATLAALSIAALVLAVHALALLVALLRGGRRATPEGGT